LLLATVIVLLWDTSPTHPIFAIGGAITVILAYLAIAGGLAHIIPTLKKRFHREPVEHNPLDDALSLAQS